MAKLLHEELLLLRRAPRLVGAGHLLLLGWGQCLELLDELLLQVVERLGLRGGRRCSRLGHLRENVLLLLVGVTA